MKITPQVIIDKEFRVKFRGFDMAEVDTFLEEVAESFFKLIEENTRLNEKVGTLKEQIQSGIGPAVPGQVELSPELENFLEELKQDTAAINAELTSLKQDRGAFASLEKGLQNAVAALKEAKNSAAGQAAPAEFSADLQPALLAFTETTGTINAELAALKEERQAFALLKKELEETLAMLREARPQAAPQDQSGNVHLATALDDFRQVTKGMGDELAALKQELSAIQKLHTENRKELQGLFKSQFDELAAKLTQPAGPVMPPAKGPVTAEPLKAAIIEEEPEDSRLSDYDEAEDDSVAGDELEFLSEDDILDVDKLRGIFQSVLDDSVSDAPSSRGDDETTADLLFFDDDLMEIEHEPAVTFSLEEKTAAGKKPGKLKKP